MTNRFVAGIIGQPFGLNGFVKVKPLSGETGHLLVLKSAVISKNGTERTLRLEKTAPAQGALLIKFEGVETPEQAKLLAGAELIVGREQAAPLGKGEFYIEDLKGLSVVSPEDTPYGVINDIIEGGGGFLAEIRLNSGGVRFVPFRNEFFGEIDAAAGRAVLLEAWILE